MTRIVRNISSDSSCGAHRVGEYGVHFTNDTVFAISGAYFTGNVRFFVIYKKATQSS